MYNFPVLLYLWEGDSLVYAWFHELHIKRGRSLVELKEKYVPLSFVLCNVRVKELCFSLC